MSAGYKTKTLVPVANVVKAGPSELGWLPDDMFRDHQISCTGLDGGTFAVKILLPGEDHTPTNLRTHATAQAQAAIVQIANLIVTYLQVEISNPGGAADPKVTITSILRGI